MIHKQPFLENQFNFLTQVRWDTAQHPMHCDLTQPSLPLSRSTAAIRGSGPLTRQSKVTLEASGEVVRLLLGASGQV